MYDFKVGDAVGFKKEDEDYRRMHFPSLKTFFILNIEGDIAFFKGTSPPAGSFLSRLELLVKGQIKLPFKENKNGTVKF